ncbi:MAG: PSD1 and planctomycete cytochrome C domain-containing protein [Planctomycetota bacterium]|nr:PSD1 and planctomycete cytochrome C domain-containing protein [Planctomycetota bacterium]
MKFTIILSGISLLLLVAIGPIQSQSAEGAAPVNFAREILPILSNKCFVCHGPDARKKDVLRLDSFEGATRDLGGYSAIDPKAPEKSEILKRIHSSDDPMPPKEAEKKLTEQERQLLSRWARQGGKYARHWAFVPPQKPQTPARESKSEILDLFIQSRLKSNGIDFAPEADRATLARRVALVLTGLPPEPEQLSDFLKDKGADAYQRLVDQLLSSERYGEHQARYWLDAVRYGDTHGLHLDNRRGIYPYRDWVVGAMNENKPMDEFITWQLAGDLLPNPTLAQQVATGFVRMNVSTAEGGAIPEEFQAKNNFDRTETLGTMMLGVSLTCARCHNHKYDPIPQDEYYRLLAFFNSTAEHSMDGNAYIYGPVISVPGNQADWKKWQELQASRDNLLAEAKARAEAKMPEVVAYAEPGAGWSTDDWSISKPVALTAAPTEKQWSKPKDLPGASRDNLPRNDKAVWVSFKVTATTDQVIHLKFSGGTGSLLFVDDVPLSTLANVPGVQSAANVPLKLKKGEHQLLMKLVGTNDQTRIEVELVNSWQAVAKSKEWGACSEEDQLLMLSEAEGPLSDLKLQQRALDITEGISHLRNSFTTTLVAKDLPTPRATRVLQRGEYHLPVGEPLEPGVLSVMGAFPKDAPRNRLGLAKWLTSREHPLVARVLVNRIWQRTLGEGIVRTPEDFGLQGQQPTHPELLDWLAVELQDSDWDLKHMLRLMVNTRAFRQSSVWRSDVDDPENRLFARGPGQRLEAEVIRDVALWAGGLLDPTMGGEGVKPYQPAGMWSALMHPGSNTKQYVQDKGPRQYRRSLYVYWKRTSPHPMMTLFDAPNRESSCVKRSRTNTPLQSLGLLNETQRVETSRMFAERLLREVGDDANRLDLMFTLLACRKPTEGERSACMNLLQAMRERFAESEKDALAFLSIGDSPRNASLNPTEHASWAQLTTTVLASDVALLLY